jgi:glyoxylase-like metal-dependent hydrolase (beta-lactamase superfamily II)
VYLLGKAFPGAVYLVETSAGLVLIDSGLEADAAEVIGQITALGLDVGRLRAVLLTHAHADHSLGAEALRRQTGAKVYAGRGDCPPLRAGGPRDALCSTFHLPRVVLHPTTVDVELAGYETLPFGDTHFRVLATPGHTPGSVCYLLERPGLRALFAGDVILHLSPASREPNHGGANADALGTYSAYLAPRYRGDARAFLTSLRLLRALRPPDLVLPGHPRMDPEPQSPRLSPRRWYELLDRGIAEMERLVARYEADGADFLDGIRKELLPGLHYLGDLDDAAVYCLDTPKGLFLFDAPGGAVLAEFLAARFRKLGWAGRKPAVVLLTSADETATAGLAALVRDTGCAVVAPKAGLAQVRRLCPDQTEMIAAEDLAKKNWFDVRTVPLAGRGLAPVAYQLRWAGKTVLLPGRIPMKLTTPIADRLLRDVKGPGGNVTQYLQALDRLAAVNPDLWLPAVPVHGQNANLYDDDWKKVLAKNRQILR